MTDSESQRAMKALLKSLLERLEKIGSRHEELYDTVVRDAMRGAVLDSFVSPDGNDAVPSTYGLFTPDADLGVQSAIRDYVKAARAGAEAAGMDESERLAAFQDGDVRTDDERQYPDDFFGWVRPSGDATVGG